jgi:hypothetical protein
MSNNGIVAFVIGLGPYVSGLNKDGTPFRTTYGGCDHPLNSDSSQSDACPDTRAARDTKAGARLLRYVADMGFDPGEVLANKKWLCHADYWERGAPDPIDDDPFQQCGNYWYAPEGRDLEHVFEEIASRMFTRLSE